MNDRDNIVAEFLAESFEQLEEVDRDVLTLESGQADRALLDRVFRAVHTIKGTCGFLELGRLEALSHAGEGLLTLLRDETQNAAPEVAPLLLELVDTLRVMLKQIQSSGKDDGVDASAVVQRLEAARERLAGKPVSGVTAQNVAARAKKPRKARTKTAAPPSRKAASRSDKTGGAVASPSPPGSVKGSGHGSPQAPTSTPSPAVAVRSSADSFVRVDVHALDRMMDLVGELVLSRNQLVLAEWAEHDASEIDSVQRLDLITSELQEAIMRTRLEPVSKVWGRFPRLARDLAEGCGKRVRLEMEGQGTELDRGLIEAIRDPLTHLVRNAVDHGIEPPEARRAAGKPVVGRIWLRASHEGGHVTIEVGDDGAGINSGAVLDRAVALGAVTAKQAARLTPGEAVRLVFLPGLSTNREVTNLSGRGVGLDVVRSNLERVNGLIDIKSSPGEGTVIRLEIPLTLAILPALVVGTGGQMFAIPQASVVELVRLDGVEGAGVEMVHGAPVYRLRGRLLPLVVLRQELGLEPDGDERTAGSIVVLEVGERQLGLVVESVTDTQEIVVKPLGALLDRIPEYAGATILGDGRVTLILDVLGLAQRAHVVTEAAHAEVGADDEGLPQLVSLSEGFLLFRSPDDGRMAIPLDRVVRLELFPRTEVERVGEGFAVQYRGDILPLVFVFDHLVERRNVPRVSDSEIGELDVVVVNYGAHTVGLVVGPVLDIVEEIVGVRQPSSREGIVECAVIRDRVTELLDVDFIVGRAGPSVFARAAGSCEST